MAFGMDRERLRRQAQKGQAMDSRQRAEAEMRAKTREIGRKALEDHVRKRVMEIVPAYYRKASELTPPAWYFAFWGRVTWLGLLPGKIFRWVIWKLFIRTGIRLQNRVWMWGSYTELEPISDRLVKVSIHRWFSCKYKCVFNVFTCRAEQEEVGE